jgi:molybdate transport system substrate-binding protein
MINIYSSGSISGAVRDAVNSHLFNEGGIGINCTVGPAGLLRRRIEEGEMFDIFISADLHNAKELQIKGITNAPIHLVKNKMSVFIKKSLHATKDTVLDILAKDGIRLGISTPLSDPAGDYAMDVFYNIENNISQELGKLLKKKAIPVVGNALLPAMQNHGKSPVVRLFREGHIDAFIGYSSSFLKLAECHDYIEEIDLPDQAAVQADYYAALFIGASDGADKIICTLLKQKAIFLKHGFIPLEIS